MSFYTKLASFYAVLAIASFGLAIGMVVYGLNYLEHFQPPAGYPDCRLDEAGGQCPNWLNLRAGAFLIGLVSVTVIGVSLVAHASEALSKAPRRSRR